jgi:hypothetical protein
VLSRDQANWKCRRKEWCNKTGPSILVKESVANFGELMMTIMKTTSKRATRKKRTI